MISKEFSSLRRKIIEKDFSHLNDMQKKAVFSTEGPLLVLAGAGSGKTSVLINRTVNIIKYGKAYTSDEFTREPSPREADLIRAAAGGLSEDIFDIEPLLSVEPANPWEILAITFTNKAAEELKERLKSSLGEKALDVWASTFHSACARMLRKNAALLGYTSNFVIYDADDSKRVVKNCLKSLDLNCDILNPKSVLFQIGRAKNAFLSPSEYKAQNCGDVRKRDIGRVYEAYQKRLRDSDAMDFDDLIVNAVLLLRNNPDVLDYYQRKFRYIMVDEYQDADYTQYLLISLLAGAQKNICVVGDDDQSIYKFRGATIENILNFERQFKNAEVVRLEQNYRSTKNIIDAANNVISRNVNRKGKRLWTDNERGELITLHEADSDRGEGAYVAETVLEGVKSGNRYSDFAVLYRMNSQSNQIEKALVKSGVPYKLIGGRKFYERREIRDALAYLSVIADPDDGVRLQRIINVPKRGIGESSAAAALEISQGLGISLFEVLKNAEQFPKLSRVAKKMGEFAKKIEYFAAFSETAELSELFKEVMTRSGYFDSLALEPETEEERRANLGELLNNITNFSRENEAATLNDFLQEIALMTDIDDYNADADSVVLMTVHSAKGLEFKNVLLVGAEESIFPSQASISEGEEEIEEERRLAYVAITRAKKKLYITRSRQRTLFGATRFNPVSRFAEEIPDELLEKTGGSSSERGFGDFYGRPQTRENVSRGFAPIISPLARAESNVEFAEGDSVRHKVYGDGVVLSVKPMGNDMLLEVEFFTTGTKKIMANYSKIEKTE